MQIAVANAIYFNELASTSRAERLEQAAKARILVSPSRRKPEKVADHVC
jgi:hypothetical protein